MKTLSEEWQSFSEDHSKLYQFFYSIAFIVAVYTYFLKRFMTDATYIHLTIVSLLLSLAVFIWHIYLKRWSDEVLFAITAILIFVVLMPHKFYMIYFLPDFSLLSFLLLSVSVDPKQSNLMRTIFYAKIFLAITVLLFYIMGKVPDVTLWRDSKQLVRHSYGFLHPNSLSMFMMSIMCDFSLMKKKALAVSELLWITLVSLLVYAITDSRTGLFTFIIILACSFFKKTLLTYEVSGKVVFRSILAIFLLGIMLSLLYQSDSPFFEFLNKIFTGRLDNAHAYIEKYGFRLLPRRVPFLYHEDGGRIFNENFYVDSLLRQGLWVYILFPIMIGFQTVNKRFTLYHFILMLSTFLIASMEDYGASICMSSILLFNYFSFPEEDEKLDDWPTVPRSKYQRHRAHHSV